MYMKQNLVNKQQSKKSKSTKHQVSTYLTIKNNKKNTWYTEEIQTNKRK